MYCFKHELLILLFSYNLHVRYRSLLHTFVSHSFYPRCLILLRVVYSTEEYHLVWNKQLKRLHIYFTCKTAKRSFPDKHKKSDIPGCLAARAWSSSFFRTSESTWNCGRKLQYSIRTDICSKSTESENVLMPFYLSTSHEAS